MSEFIRKDKIYQVPIVDGELLLSPSHDFIHHFQRNGAYILKYWQPHENPPRFSNVPINEEQVRFLLEHCEMEVLERQYMGEQEFQHYTTWVEAQGLEHLDFDLEDPGEL